MGVLLLLNFLGTSHAQTPCANANQWWNGTTCLPCTTHACGVGMFRATCTTSSIHDAVCTPCKMPPSNSVHITGGLPYTVDNCMWLCVEGFRKLNDHCEACTATQCPFPLVRETCSLGSTTDARCVCPVHTFMNFLETSTAEGGGNSHAGKVLLPVVGQKAPHTCSKCAHNNCTDPLREKLMACPGTTTVDVSKCVATMVVAAAAPLASPVVSADVPAVAAVATPPPPPPVPVASPVVSADVPAVAAVSTPPPPPPVPVASPVVSADVPAVAAVATPPPPPPVPVGNTPSV